MLVAPTRSRLTQSRFRMQNLAGLPLILMPADYCLRKMVEAECAEARIKTQVVLEMTSPEGILQAVAEGAGLTILPELYVRLRLAGSGLRIIELYDPVPHHSVGLAYARAPTSKSRRKGIRHPLPNHHGRAPNSPKTASHPTSLGHFEGALSPLHRVLDEAASSLQVAKSSDRMTRDGMSHHQRQRCCEITQP